jgi:hypothetical protein
VSLRRAAAIVGFGLINYLARFIVGGVLFMGLRMDPASFAFGFILTATAALAAYVLLKFVMKPGTVRQALIIAAVWAAMALILDILTAEPVVQVTVSYLLAQPQTWTRLIVILLVAPFTVRKNPAIVAA